jgi:hypothetical protein
MGDQFSDLIVEIDVDHLLEVELLWRFPSISHAEFPSVFGRRFQERSATGWLMDRS